MNLGNNRIPLSIQEGLLHVHLTSEGKLMSTAMKGRGKPSSSGHIQNQNNPLNNITNHSLHAPGLSCVNGQQEKPRSIRLQEKAAIYLFNFFLFLEGNNNNNKKLVTDSQSSPCLGV